MDRSDVITLIAKVNTKDSKGVTKTIESKKNVYCNVGSVTSSEFFNGGNSGLKPAYKFTVFSYDYAGETTVEYKNARYSVYRTYMAKNDNLELYVEKDLGS